MNIHNHILFSRWEPKNLIKNHMKSRLVCLSCVDPKEKKFEKKNLKKYMLKIVGPMFLFDFLYL